MEKSVSGLLETGARRGGSGNQTRDLLACAERTRTSISAATELNWLHSISTNLMHFPPCTTKLMKNPLECNPLFYTLTSVSHRTTKPARGRQTNCLLAADNKFTVIKLARAALINRAVII